MGAVIGALAGFVGSVFLNWRIARQTRRAAARAVLAEMFTNAERALGAESTLVIHEFFDTAWRTQLPLVAALLRWSDLKTLVRAYDGAARAYTNSDPITTMTQPAAVGRWFLTVAEEWTRAVQVLLPKAIRWRERARFNRDLQDIQQRLKSATEIKRVVRPPTSPFR